MLSEQRGENNSGVDGLMPSSQLRITHRHAHTRHSSNPVAALNSPQCGWEQRPLNLQKKMNLKPQVLRLPLALYRAEGSGQSYVLGTQEAIPPGWLL